MALNWTTTELLAAIRSDARIADDEPSATDADLLREATRVLHETFVPLVRAARADYYLTTARLPLVAGKRSYAIPRRAATASVRRVRLLDAAGRPTELAPLPLEDVVESLTSTTPRCYAVADDRIVVTPVPTTASHTLELVFEYRPAALVLPSAARAVTNYGYVAPNHVVTVSLDLGLNDGDMVDIVRQASPFSAAMLDAVVDFSAAGLLLGIADGGYIGEYGQSIVQTGDWVCVAGESPIPQLPAELHPALAQYTASQFLRPIAPEDADRLKADAEGATARLLKAMAPRKQGAQMKMRPRTRFIATSSGGRRGGTFGDMA